LIAASLTALIRSLSEDGIRSPEASPADTGDMAWPPWIGIAWGILMVALGWRTLVDPESQIDGFRWWEHRPEWGSSRQPLAHDRDQWILVVRITGTGMCFLGAIIAITSIASAL
jgi:hypothetical protein